MSGKDKVGLAALVLTLLGGAWLAAAPWLVGYQASGAAWTAGTRNEFWLGFGLVALSLSTLVVYVASGLRSLVVAKAAQGTATAEEE